jgi:hypothetical protein
MNKATSDTKPSLCGDEVLQEIWRIKDALSAARGHSVKKLFAEARKRQKHSGHRVVNLSDLRKRPEYSATTKN